MARTFRLKTSDILNAAKRLRLLKQSTDTPTPGIPAPPFGSTLRVGAALRALLPFVQDYAEQESKVQAEFAMKDGENYKTVTDANGNIVNGAFYIGNAPMYTTRMSALQNETHDVTLGMLTIDDIVNVGQDRIGPDAIAEVLPILDDPDAEPTQETLDRLERYYAAMRPTSAPVAVVPQRDPGAPSA